MAVSVKDLQQEAEAIQGLCPNLLPSSVPHGFDVEDLWGLAHTEGKSEREALKQCLAAAARQAQSSSRCCVCETAGDPSVSSSTQDDEAHTLRFTTFSHLDFTSKSIKLTGAGFACGHCRALLEPQRFLHFAALRLNDKHPDRVVLAQELCAHFAATNQAPEHVQTNPDALALWVQELMSRAYALQVVASNVHGWRLLGPAGEPVRQAAKGTSTRLAKALLEAKEGITSRSQHQAQATSPSHPASTKKKAGSAKKRLREGVTDAEQGSSLLRGKQEEQDEQEEEEEEHHYIREASLAPLNGQGATPDHKQQQQQQQQQHHVGNSAKKKRSSMGDALHVPAVGSTKKQQQQQQQQEEHQVGNSAKKKRPSVEDASQLPAVQSTKKQRQQHQQQQQQQGEHQEEHQQPATPNGHTIAGVERKRKAKTPGPSKSSGDAFKDGATEGQEQARLKSAHKKQTPLVHKKKARLSL